MRVLFETDPAAFGARVEPSLLAREIENNLLFGLTYAIRQGRYEDVLLAIVEDDDGEVAGAALRTPPHDLVLSVAEAEAVALLAATIEPPIPSVNGTGETSRIFAEAWAARTGATAEVAMRQRIYALHEVRPVNGVDGAARAATQVDRALLVEWLTAFEVEALQNHAADPADADRRVSWYLDDDHAGLLVWEAGGEPVALAGFSGPTPNGIRVGPVYTPPERRARGYASALVADLSARMLAAGRRYCALYTDLSNPTSNSIYQRIGYEPVCDATRYRFA